MRQSITDFEAAFLEEAVESRDRREEAVRATRRRAKQRHVQRAHRRGTLRFVLLVAVLIATAVLVTLAMFEALYRVTA